MILLLFALGCVLLTFCLYRKKSLGEGGRQKRPFEYFLVRHAVRFLVPFLAASLFYTVVEYKLLIINRDTTTINTLLSAERFLETCTGYVSRLRITPFIGLVVLSILFSTGMLARRIQNQSPGNSASRRWQGSLTSWYKYLGRYQKVVETVYVVLVAFAAFTFFGSFMGPPGTGLKLRVKGIRDGYAEMDQRVRIALEEQACDELLARLSAAPPPAYATLCNLADSADKIEGNLDRLQTKSEVVAAVLPGRPDSPEEREARARALALGAETSEDRGRLAPGQTAQFSEGLLSSRTIESLREWLQKHKDRTTKRLGSVVCTNGFSQVTAHLVKFLSYPLNFHSIRVLVNQYPLLEPVSDIFSDALEGTIAQVSDRIVQNVFATSLKQPSTDLSVLVDREVAEGLREIPAPTPTPGSMVNARLSLMRKVEELNQAVGVANQALIHERNRLAAQLRREWADMRNSDSEHRVARSVHKRAVDGLIADVQAIHDPLVQVQMLNAAIMTVQDNKLAQLEKVEKIGDQMASSQIPANGDGMRAMRSLAYNLSPPGHASTVFHFTVPERSIGRLTGPSTLGRPRMPVVPKPFMPPRPIWTPRPTWRPTQRMLRR